ncbi:MAG: transglutaminase domain-containing protein [Deltaproteobacteria bacterium]|nr:transglutaminase domain-containing protein [Deltaproteobacteria bacterium]
MRITNLRWHWIAGAFFIALFAVLLSIHLGALKKPPSAVFPPKSSEHATLTPKETWMNISQNGRKIGYSHRTFVNTGKGYKFSETVFMRINTMGMVQPMSFKTEGLLNRDMSLASFSFNLQSSLFNFEVRGFVEGGNLSIYTGPPGHQNKAVLTPAKVPYLANSVLDMAAHSSLIAGQSRTFHVFDPITMGDRPVKVTFVNREKIATHDGEKEVKKMVVDFMGVQQFAWIDDEGTVIKEEGLLGVSLEKVSSREALREFASSSADLTDIASIKADTIITDPAALTELKLKLINADKKLFLNGDRQIFENDLLTIRKESLKPSVDQSDKAASELAVFLSPSPFIQSDDTDIKQKTEQIVLPSDSAVVKAGKIVQWIHQHLEKRPTLSIPNALETLKTMTGDCNEHAALLAAMARAAGIPAQIEAGLVYQKGRFYYHAWNVLYLGTWVTADAVFGQLPADVTHIRLVRGSEEKQIDLLSTIGHLKIHIEDYR